MCLVMSRYQRIRNVPVSSPQSYDVTRCRCAWEEYKDFEHFAVIFFTSSLSAIFSSSSTSLLPVSPRPEER